MTLTDSPTFPSLPVTRGLLLPLVLVLVSTFCASTANAQPDAQPEGNLASTVSQEGDEALAKGLALRFDEIQGLSDLEVSVNAGVVTLSGRVLEESQRQEALTLAGRVEGVALVRDEITVELDPSERLGPALDKAMERLRTLISYTPLLVISILIFLCFAFLSRLAGRFDGLFSRLSSNRFAQDLMRQAMRVAILLIGVLIALEILDATALVGAVLGTAGVIGLALGFAFKDLVENYISSILLSIRQPFEPNDFVQIDGFQGKVVRLTSRATVLMTLDGNHLRIPNSQVFKGVITNFSRNPQRRFSFGVGVGVGEDLGEAQKLGIRAIEEMEGILQDPRPSALIEELGDSNVLIRFYGWVDQRDFSYSKVKSAAIRKVKTVLEDAGMDLPEPIYRVHLLEPGAASGEAAKETKAAASADRLTSPDDVSKDEHLEKQIERDRQVSGSESDLLVADGRSE